jgi:hypothetical protein
MNVHPICTKGQQKLQQVQQQKVTHTMAAKQVFAYVCASDYR